MRVKNTRNSFPPPPPPLRKFGGFNGRALRCRVNDNSSFRDNTIKGVYVTEVKADRELQKILFLPNERSIIHFDTGRFCPPILYLSLRPFLLLILHDRGSKQ